MTKSNTKTHLKLSTNKVFFGVAGTIAESVHMSYALTRMLLLILIVCTGIIPGLIIYLIAYSVIKSESK